MTRVWMSLQTKEKNHYVIRLIAGIAGIILLAFLLVFLCARIMIELDEYKEIVSLLMCIGVTGLIISFSVWLGRTLQRDAMIFYEDPTGRLYVSDVRQYIGYRRGIIGAVQMALLTQRELAGLKKQVERQGFCSDGMTEILKVDVMKEHSGSYSLVCRVKYGEKRTGRRTYILGKGYDNESQLLYVLERKKKWENSVEIAKSRKPICIFLSFLVFCIFAVLCLFSHPYFAKLPQEMYFPSLGCAFAAFCCMIYFTVQYRRGESAGR